MIDSFHTARPHRATFGLRGCAGAYVLLAPFFIFFLIFWLAPLIGGIRLSLASDTLYGPSEFVGGAHYRALLQDERFGKALRNTVLYLVGTWALILPLALVLAQGLHRVYARLRPWLTFGLLVPGLTPPAVLALLFLLVFHGQEGLLNRLFVVPWGAEPIQWLKDPRYILAALVLQAIWRWTGFITFFFLAGMEAIPRTLYEAACLETNNPWRVWQKVTVPMLRPVVGFAAFYLLIDAFSLFSGAYVLLGGSGGTDDAGLLFISYVYQTAFTFGKFGTAAAMCVCVGPALLGVTWLFYLRRKQVPVPT